MRLLPNFKLKSPVAAHFVPSDRFFLRFVPLAPDLPALAQAELALEGLAPFPPAQLYWGCCVAPDHASALVYAAHRRRFTAEETAKWERAELVVPDLLALLGAAPAGPALLVLTGERSLGGAAWDGQAAWPVAVHARDFGAAPSEDNRRQFAAELAAKARLKDAPVTYLTEAPRARREGDRLVLELDGADAAMPAALSLARADQNALDVRDRDFLAKRRRNQNRGELIWRVLLGGVAVAAGAAAADAGALSVGLYHRVERRQIELQAPLVQKLETAHGLTSRIDELTHRRLRFFEMLAAINASRPGSIQFNRTGTSGRNALEIEAQTGSADDVGRYETSLRALPGLEKVEVRDLRARDGVTTFGLSVAFKPEATPGGVP